jgi:hypothetical protein
MLEHCNICVLILLNMCPTWVPGQHQNAGRAGQCDQDRSPKGVALPLSNQGKRRLIPLSDVRAVSGQQLRHGPIPEIRVLSLLISECNR